MARDYRNHQEAQSKLEIRHLHQKVDVLLKHQCQKLLEIQQIQMDFMKELVRKEQNEKVAG